jgi:hypothetical protein
VRAQATACGDECPSQLIGVLGRIDAGGFDASGRVPQGGTPSHDFWLELGERIGSISERPSQPVMRWISGWAFERPHGASQTLELARERPLAGRRSRFCVGLRGFASRGWSRRHEVSASRLLTLRRCARRDESDESHQRWPEHWTRRHEAAAAKEAQRSSDKAAEHSPDESKKHSKTLDGSSSIAAS